MWLSALTHRILPERSQHLLYQQPCLRYANNLPPFHRSHRSDPSSSQLFVPYNEESAASPFVTNTTAASSSALHPPTQRPVDEPSIRPRHLISPLPTTAPIIPPPPTSYQPTRVYFRRSARLRSTTLKKAVESMAKKHTIAVVSDRATADNHASRSTRATKTPTHLFVASHDTDDTPTTLHRPTRKRKKHDTASASPPAKRHRKAIKPTRAHAKTTPGSDHEDSDSGSGEDSLSCISPQLEGLMTC